MRKCATTESEGDEVEGTDKGVQSTVSFNSRRSILDNGEYTEGYDIKPLGTLWTVSQRKDELKYHKGDVEILDDYYERLLDMGGY